MWEAMQKAKKSNEEPIEDNSTETVAYSEKHDTAKCDRCNGTGRHGDQDCKKCGGDGWIDAKDVVKPSGATPQEKPKQKNPGKGPARLSRSPYGGAGGAQHKFL